jgi:hypothetical protein
MNGTALNHGVSPEQNCWNLKFITCTLRAVANSLRIVAKIDRQAVELNAGESWPNPTSRKLQYGPGNWLKN